MAGSVALSLSSYTNVGRDSAKISCSAWDWVYPSDHNTTTETGDDANGSKTTISYSNTVWSWSFSDGGRSSSKEPTHTFTGLTAGKANTCRGTLSARCTRTVTRTSWRTDSEGKKTTTGPTSNSTSYNLGSASDSITVYTKPAAFYWGAGVSQGSTIQASNALTAASWNTLVTRVEERANWINQKSGASYSSAKVNPGDLVTAAVYNVLARALGVSTVTAHTKNTTGTLITASVFIALQTAVNS